MDLIYIAFVLVAVTAIIGLALAVRPDLAVGPLQVKYGAAPSRYLSLDGMQVHYRDQGRTDGESLLLLHGSNVSLHAWEPWVEALSGSFRIVTLDLPGHGFTGPMPGDDYDAERVVDFLKRFVDALSLAPMVIGGNSYGGFLSWLYTVKYPDDVSKLILINAVGYPYPDPLVWRLAKYPLLEPLFTSMTPRFLVKATLAEAIHDPRAVSEEQITRYYELTRLPGNRRAQIIQNRIPYGYTARPERLAQLKEIRVPTLLLWGERDPWLPLSYAQKFVDDIPDAKLISYEQVGHIPMEECPEKSAADVARFVSA